MLPAWRILQYFQPSLGYHLSLRSCFCLFLSGHLRQVLLYNLPIDIIISQRESYGAHTVWALKFSSREITITLPKIIKLSQKDRKLRSVQAIVYRQMDGCQADHYPRYDNIPLSYRSCHSEGKICVQFLNCIVNGH